MSNGERDWSREEVEAAVAAYLDMLTLELEGGRYNKTANRRELRKLLRDRSDTSVERKHMNISAVLVEMDHPYINGYKPYGNFQRSLLPVVVAEHLNQRHTLRALVQRLAAAEPKVPTIDDILARLVDPPEPPVRADRYKEALRPHISVKTDFVLRESNNRALGLAGELFVLNFEIARLVAEDRDHLAAKVEHVAATQGDGTGFDILSFDRSGLERLVEVKTTKAGQYMPFYVSSNEINVSRDRGSAYHVYRVYSFETDPRLFMRTGAIDQAFLLTPEQYIARVG